MSPTYAGRSSVKDQESHTKLSSPTGTNNEKAVHFAGKTRKT